MFHFAATTTPIMPPIPPPPPQNRGVPTTPSLSPISVVRNKRANQANWEKHQRKNSQVEQLQSDTIVENCVTPILCSRRQSCTEEEDVHTDNDQITEDSHAEDLTVPPPPSPPCTCGKNLELPPTPPLDDLEANQGSNQFPGRQSLKLSEIVALQEAIPERKPQNF